MTRISSSCSLLQPSIGFVLKLEGLDDHPSGCCTAASAWNSQLLQPLLSVVHGVDVGQVESATALMACLPSTSKVPSSC